MTILTILLTSSLLALIFLGMYLNLYSDRLQETTPRWVKGSALANLALFALGIMGMFVMSVNEVMAANTVAGETREISIGLGLALLGIGLPTGMATIGAGIAVSSVGSASLAVITEKPEMFGRTLIYLGLAEGIAIYGLVVTILLLGKV